MSLVPRLPQSPPMSRTIRSSRRGDGLMCGRRAEFVDPEDASEFATSSQCARTAERQLQESARPGRLCQDARTSCSQAVRSFCLRLHVSKICRSRFNRFFETSARELSMMPKVLFRPYQAVQRSVRAIGEDVISATPDARWCALESDQVHQLKTSCTHLSMHCLSAASA